VKRTPIRRRTRLRRRRVARRRSPRVVNDAYLAFIRSLPCAGCGIDWSADPHHAGKHGVGQTAGDDTAIPLCRRCHDAVHDAKGKYADQDVRRRWEELVQVGCQVLWCAWQARRRSGFPLSHHARAAFNAAWSVADEDINRARERAMEE
jgi:hypothetical protein